ncbi:MAG: AAA family ATPase, partial [Bacteroides sp.]|nr:AAA family ATPase [Bacteroides sp.]
MGLLRRKVDNVLLEWKNNPDKKPLVVKGARQVGKSESVRNFGRKNYKSMVEINFALQKKYKVIFNEGYEVDTIIKNITLLDSSLEFIPGETLIFFDELQEHPDCATSLKSFKIDGRYDVICSGSLMGIHYKEIESNSVGYKMDYEMHSMDFEEFLWAVGYREEQIEELYRHMKELRPLSEIQMEVFHSAFRDYMTLGGMPEVVNKFVSQKNFSGTLALQRQLLVDYEQDITKYAEGMDRAKIKNVYNH